MVIRWGVQPRSYTSGPYPYGRSFPAETALGYLVQDYDRALHILDRVAPVSV